MSKKQKHFVLWTKDGKLNISCLIFSVLLLIINLNASLLAEQIEDKQELNSDEPELLDEENGDLYDMSLEELMEVEISTSSLTKTTKRKTPATITRITCEQIQRSGARSLIELLDIYVPNFQWIFDKNRIRHMGLRGVMSTRDDKYLLLVNGRVMNEKTDFGVFSERDLPMLGDIQYVEVVRGSGSALYGPGALLMVINIVTENSNTFQGFEATYKHGWVEEHNTTEFKYGKQFGEDHGLFLFGGFSEYRGQDSTDAPINYNGRVRIGSTWYEKGELIDFRPWGYNKAYKNPRLKLHGQYNNGNLTVWTRYTQGGEYVTNAGQWNNIRSLRDQGWGYRQGTIEMEYEQELASELSLKYTLSYDRTEVVSHENSPYQIYHNTREDEYYGRLLALWQPNKKHSIAFGAAISHEKLGRSPHGYDQAILDTYNAGTGGVLPQWNTDMVSLLGEWQYTINDQWTTFISARLDDHLFTVPMFSPRGAIVYTPNEKDTYKFMISRAVRTSSAADMLENWVEDRGLSDVEQVDTLELRYERQHTNHLWFGGSAFYSDHELVEYSSDTGGEAYVGDQKSWGFELETAYRRDTLNVSLSHSFAQLLDMKLLVARDIISVEERGYGDDFAAWFDHSTKLRIEYDLDDKWRLDSSLSIYWSNPGGQDLARYVYDNDGASKNKVDIDANDPYDLHAYLNLGLEYQHNENLSFRLDGYNLMGWFNDQYNIRRIGLGTYRPSATYIPSPSFAVQLKITF